MADKNKVVYGLSKLAVGTFTEVNGTVTLGTPVQVPGAISLSVEPEGEDSEVYADNVKYWSTYNDNGFSGSIEVVKFPDEFRVAFMNYAKTAGGGLAAVKGKQRPAVYILGQTEGDQHDRRFILYNASLGGIKNEYKTKESSVEVATESMDIKVNGDNSTGITMASYYPDDTGYKTLFTTPPVPALETSTSKG